jgi:hypothetical protein
MKKNVWIFGVIAGLISSLWVAVFPFLGDNCGTDMGMVYGYTAMIIAFSMIFVGVKNYRDRFNNGEVAFGRAFMIGFYIALIGSTFYVVTWLISYYFFIPDFFDKMSASYVKQMQEKGATQADINKQIVEIAKYKEYAKNPFFNAAMTYMEILPVGVLVSLICAAILKRKPNQPQIA